MVGEVALSRRERRSNWEPTRCMSDESFLARSSIDFSDFEILSGVYME